MSFIDATCLKCGKRIGWQGTLLDRPSCPKCGFRPPNSELQKAEDELDLARQEIDAQHKAELDAATEKERRVMAEGAEAVKSESKFLDVHRFNPYKGTDLQKWWIRGWRQKYFQMRD